MSTTSEQLTAQFLVLLVGKLTGWGQLVPSDGGPVYLTGEQTAALATEGISLLARFLPQEAAAGVASAIKGLARPRQAPAERAILSIGGLGGHIPSNGPPGCCVGTEQGLVCVR
jgi:hypothetical protein